MVLWRVHRMGLRFKMAKMRSLVNLMTKMTVLRSLITSPSLLRFPTLTVSVALLAKTI